MYNHAPENYICPFCLLIQGQKNEHVYSTQADIIFQSRFITAFVGSHQWPRNPGNTIVVPNEHFENIFDLPAHYAEKIHTLVRMIAVAMKDVYACDGISTRQHNEPAGYQDVWHYHVHVTPRYIDDKFYPTYQDRQLMPASERAEHAEKLRNGLAKLVNSE